MQVCHSPSTLQPAFCNHQIILLGSQLHSRFPLANCFSCYSCLSQHIQYIRQTRLFKHHRLLTFHSFTCQYLKDLLMFCVANLVLHNKLLSNELQSNQQSTKRLHGLLHLYQENGKRGREQLNEKITVHQVEVL